MQNAETEWNIPSFSASGNGNSVRKRTVRMAAPTPSTVKARIRSRFWCSTTSFMLDPMDSAITSCCWMEIFRRRLNHASEAADINPRPPISIIIRMTTWPKLLHWLQVSASTRPVTQVADVAVKSAVTGPALCPFLEETGRTSRIAPHRMIPKNVSAMTRLMLIACRFFRRFTDGVGLDICFPSFGIEYTPYPRTGSISPGVPQSSVFSKSIRSTLLIFPPRTTIFAMVTSLPKRALPQLPGFSHSRPSIRSSL